mmetsp:Transcript_36016/g.93700  ORF Transcript_36016/g.93700 Transcript_36016/m.93700 type:complete len:92 (-) Transcript_36016:26-301(-)
MRTVGSKISEVQRLVRRDKFAEIGHLWNKLSDQDRPSWGGIFDIQLSSIPSFKLHDMLSNALTLMLEKVFLRRLLRTKKVVLRNSFLNFTA